MRLTRTQIKSMAQDELMHGVGNSFAYAEDTAVPQEVLNEMEIQMRRIEKLFGYVPGSWLRGA